MRWIAYGCGPVVLVFSGIAILEYIFTWNSGIDEILLRDVAEAMFTASPGRMALTSASCLFLMSLALLLRDAPKCDTVIDSLLLGAMVIALLGLLSTVYQTDFSIGIVTTSRISQMTALLVFTECIALLAIRPSQGIMRLMSSRTAAGLATRFLLPASFLIPISVAWLHFAGQHTGLYAQFGGVALVAFLNSTLFILLAIGGARWLMRSDEKRQEKDRLFSTVMEHSSGGIALIDSRGTVSFTSSSTNRLLGYPGDEFVGRSFIEITHPDDRLYVTHHLLNVASKHGNVVTVVVRLKHKEGHWLWIEAVARNLMEDPIIHAIVVNYRDITDL